MRKVCECIKHLSGESKPFFSSIFVSKSLFEKCLLWCYVNVNNAKNGKNFWNISTLILLYLNRKVNIGKSFKSFNNAGDNHKPNFNSNSNFSSPNTFENVLVSQYSEEIVTLTASLVLLRCGDIEMNPGPFPFPLQTKTNPTFTPISSPVPTSTSTLIYGP